MKLQSQQDKVFATNMKKYNAKVPMQNVDICNKTKETFANKSQLEKTQVLSKTKHTLNEKYGIGDGMKRKRGASLRPAGYGFDEC